MSCKVGFNNVSLEWSHCKFCEVLIQIDIVMCKRMSIYSVLDP